MPSGRRSRPACRRIPRAQKGTGAEAHEFIPGEHATQAAARRARYEWLLRAGIIQPFNASTFAKCGGSHQVAEHDSKTSTWTSSAKRPHVHYLMSRGSCRAMRVAAALVAVNTTCSPSCDLPSASVTQGFGPELEASK